MQRGRRMWWLLVACGILVLGAIAWSAYARQREASARIFFAAALRSEHITERVVADGTAYTVLDGQVAREDQGAVTDGEIFNALRVAYALALAQRFPLIAIPGTDPEQLDHAVTSLERVASELAAIQKDQSGKDAVKSSLYPIDFLHSLARLERARLTFIGSGSNTDETRYERAAGETVQAFEKDMRLHKAAFTRIVPQGAVAYQVFEGTITRDSLLNSMDALMRGVLGTSAALDKQHACLSGAISACDTSRLVLWGSTSTPASQSNVVSKDTLFLLHEIKSSYASATGDASYTGPVFALTKSACLGTLDAPPLFILQDRRKGTDAMLITPEFVGDMLFVPTALYKDIPFYRYFADNQIAYVYFPIWEHYKCPELALDTARVFETNIIRDTAQTERFSQYAKVPDAAALRGLEARLAHPPSGIIEERDARAYIARAEQALSQQSNVPARIMTMLLDISLANEYGTAHFEQFIRRLVRDEEVNMGLMRVGVPVELGAEYLFYVRSGFFSLFLGTNPSVAGVQSPPVEREANSTAKSPFVLYTALRATIPQSELIHDMAFFFQIHRKASKRAAPVQ